MGTFVLKQSVQAVLFKMSSVFVWTVCFVVAHTMADLSEASAAFSVSPSTLAYTTTVGGPTQARGVTVTNTGSTALTVTWADSINWLVAIQPGITQTIQPGQSGAFTLTASTAGLISGTYSGTATIAGGGIIKQVVPVTLTVTQATPTSGFSVSPSMLAYTGTVGGSTQARGVTVTNTGTSTLTVTWSDPINWLVATSGDAVTMPPGGSATITHTASPAGLGAGTYSGTATIAVGGIIKQVVPVTLTVTSGSTTPAIGLAPTNLAFTESVGGANQARGVTVTNTGSTALTVTWADSINWLVAIQPGIKQTIQPGQSGAFTLTASTAGLTAGTYSGMAKISGGGITKQVPVAMTVASGGSTTPAVGLAPTNLAFIGSVGGANPAAQTISIANTGGGTLTWSASDNAPWLTVSPASGSGNGTVTATVNTAGLVAGNLNASITVVAPGATTKSVPVTLTVTALSTGAATLSWNASISSDVVGYKVYKGTGSGVYGAPIVILKGSVLSYQGIGLNANTTYFFVVTAYDAAGNESLHSNEVSKSIY